MKKLKMNQVKVNNYNYKFRSKQANGTEKNDHH